MAHDAQYPDRPITILVSARVGGPSDDLARRIGVKLTARWGVAVEIVNRRPMNACFADAADAAPDGYTLVMGGGGYYINANLYRNLPFDPKSAFDPVSLVASIANVLIVHPDFPARTVGEFIAEAKRRPGKLKYGTSGFASPPHLAGELFQQMTGCQIVPVPYRGHVAAGNALARGELDFMFDAVLSAMPHIVSGDVRALAVTPLNRLSVLPDVPTISESGVEGYEINPDMGVLVPAGTPRAIVDLLNAAINDAVKSEDLSAHLVHSGMIPLGTTPEAFGAYMATGFEKWGNVLKGAGIAQRESPSMAED